MVLKGNSLASKIICIPISSELTNSEILKIAKSHNFQVFDLNAVKSEFQVNLAFFHAEKAFEQNSNISKDLLLEFLIRVAGIRQINKAIEKVGIKNTNQILVTFSPNFSKVNSEDEILKLLKAKKIKWKQTEDKNEILRMVELQLEK